MPDWKGSDRASRLPSDWRTIRKRIWRRDNGLCQVKLSSGRRCLELADEVDHIERGDDHSDENLMCICSYHHGIKSGREGAAAAKAKRDAGRQRYRRGEQHPGLL